MHILISEAFGLFSSNNFDYICYCFVHDPDELVCLHPAIFLEMTYEDADLLNRNEDFNIDILEEAKVELALDDLQCLSKFDYAINVLGAKVEGDIISLTVNNDLLHKVYDFDTMLKYHKDKLASKKAYQKNGYLTKSQLKCPNTILATLLLQGDVYRDNKNHYMVAYPAKEELTSADEKLAESLMSDIKIIMDNDIARYVY